MTDLELTKLCAEAIGYRFHGPIADGYLVWQYPDSASPCGITYNPLHDDAQCFALVKRFKLAPWWRDDLGKWECSSLDDKDGAVSTDLNRAIVECTARMRLARRNDQQKHSHSHPKEEAADR